MCRRRGRVSQLMASPHPPCPAWFHVGPALFTSIGSVSGGRFSRVSDEIRDTVFHRLGTACDSTTNGTSAAASHVGDASGGRTRATLTGRLSAGLEG